MCDYCDCRSHTELTALAAEHERLTELLDELEASRGEAMRHAAAALAPALLTHAAREERGVFTALRREVGDAYVNRFEADHAALHQLLGAAAEGDADSAHRLASLLRHHIATEESDAFPAAHQLLTPDEWNAVADAAPASA